MELELKKKKKGGEREKYVLCSKAHSQRIQNGHSESKNAASKSWAALSSICWHE